jgi:putative membrane protein insertion efficiency factor
MSVLGSALIFLVRVYQATLGPHLGNCCRFEPSCSNYSIEAFRLHGPWRGLLLTCRRLLRCHPFGPCGHDPVPSSIAPSSNAQPPRTPLAIL